MALVVEDGTGKIDAESYADVSFADSYHAARGNTAWAAASEPNKEIALRSATDHIEIFHGQYFKGEAEFPDTPQALAFPRTGIDGYTGVPTILKKAVAEYALRALSAKLQADPIYDASGRPVVSKKSKAGPIESEVTYLSGSSVVLRSYPVADALLRPLKRSSSGLIRA